MWQIYANSAQKDQFFSFLSANWERISPRKLHALKKVIAAHHRAKEESLPMQREHIYIYVHFTRERGFIVGKDCSPAIATSYVIENELWMPLKIVVNSVCRLMVLAQGRCNTAIICITHIIWHLQSSSVKYDEVKKLMNLKMQLISLQEFQSLLNYLCCQILQYGFKSARNR